jgi:hypothetical protein
MTTLFNKKIMFYLTLVLLVSAFGILALVRPALAKGEDYSWISTTQVKAKNGNVIKPDNLFTATDWALSNSSVKGKRARLDKKIEARGRYANRPGTYGQCNLYLALEFLNKDGTLADMVRASSYAKDVSDSNECFYDGDKYEYSKLAYDYDGSTLKTSNISIDRPTNLVGGSTLLDQLNTTATNGIKIPQGCPGGPAGEKAPGTICPISVADTKTVTCGFLPQWLCDQASSELPTTDKPLGGIQVVIDYVINIVTGLFVIAVILIIVVSGVQISASAGNPDVIKNAKNHIFNALVGLALLISLRAILSVFGIYETGFAPPVTLFSKINRSNLSLNDFQQLLLNGIAIATFAAGLVSIIFMIVGGIRYTISAGRPDAMKGAKNTVLYALVGLIISIMAYGIVTFVVDSLT